MEAKNKYRSNHVCLYIEQVCDIAVRVICEIACTQEYPKPLQHYATVVCFFNHILSSPTGFIRYLFSALLIRSESKCRFTFSMCITLYDSRTRSAKRNAI